MLKFWVNITILKEEKMAKMINVKGVIFTSASTIIVSFVFFEPADTVPVLLFPFPL
jgi:hypothetical protein